MEMIPVEHAPAVTEYPKIDVTDGRRCDGSMTTLRAGVEAKSLPLRLIGIGKRYETPEGELVALRDISLDVHQGELISIIGPSGCGKTTLFNIAGGLLAPSEGEVMYMGAAQRPQRRTIGMVFQEDSALPWRTTLENVAFPLEVAGVPRNERLDRARRALSLVGLEGFENHYPSTLSGGMRQRTVLARTLVSEPTILLMDEPFAALDSQTRLLVGDKVSQIQQALAQTTLLITHDLNEAVQLSDRVVVMTSRPGRVRRIIEVDLPRPRSSKIVGSERFAHLVGMIWNDLREEAALGMKDREGG
jgi:NitT/TauT family transport system ATP-binding protein